MTKYEELPERFWEVAVRQHGVIGAAQWHEMGVSDAVIVRLVGDGEARLLGSGVVALTPETWMQNVWAGVLLGGEGSVVGGLAAAFLHGLMESPPSRIDIYSPPGQPSRPGALRAGVIWVPYTGLEQTIVDVAGTVTDDQMAALLAEAGDRLDVKEVLALLAECSPQGRKQLHRLLADFEDSGHGAMVSDFARLVEGSHGLPAAVYQGTDGKGVSSFLFEEFGLKVEFYDDRHLPEESGASERT